MTPAFNRLIIPLAWFRCGRDVVPLSSLLRISVLCVAEAEPLYSTWFAKFDSQCTSADCAKRAKLPTRSQHCHARVGGSPQQVSLHVHGRRVNLLTYLFDFLAELLGESSHMWHLHHF